jgi:uncharacterized protein YeaO (DUF488 family)
MPKAAGRLETARWNDPPVRGGGRRILVCRFRPRGLRKEAETWDEWLPHLAPSRELLAAYHGKEAAPIAWGEFRRRYLAEMKAQKEPIAALAGRVSKGERITLLCSSACTDPARCHRTVLAALVDEAR